MKVFLSIESILSSILARDINNRRYKLGTDTFEWNGFMDCIRMLSKEVHLSLNEFVKKMLTIDEFSFQRWRVDSQDVSLDEELDKRTNRPWDTKKVYSFICREKKNVFFFLFLR